MNKSDLIEAIARDAGISKTAAKDVLDSFMKNIRESLKKGERVTLIGLGSWTLSKRAARSGRNPQTGKTIQIAAKNVIKFSPSRILRGDDTGPKIVE
jgi:DNA-binding protein HU-beta